MMRPGPSRDWYLGKPPRDCSTPRRCWLSPAAGPCCDPCCATRVHPARPVTRRRFDTVIEISWPSFTWPFYQEISQSIAPLITTTKSVRTVSLPGWRLTIAFGCLIEGVAITYTPRLGAARTYFPTSSDTVLSAIRPRPSIRTISTPVMGVSWVSTTRPWKSDLSVAPISLVDFQASIKSSPRCLMLRLTVMCQ